MVFPAPPGPPGLSQPSGCCPPPPSLTLVLDIVRSTSLSSCDDAAGAHETVALTWNGTDHYNGSFFYASDTYTVTLTLSGGTWTLLITNTAGCGLANCTYSKTASSYLGPWVDFNSTFGGGVCGCANLRINYTGLSVS